MKNFQNLKLAFIFACLSFLACNEVEEAVDCDLAFSSSLNLSENATGVTAVFEANELSITTDTRYLWSIGDTAIANEDSSRLEISFAMNGTYSVCVFTETPECPEGITYCEEISIEGIEFEEMEPCTNFDIDKEAKSDDGKTYFFRATDGANIPYTWYINDEEIIFDESYHPTDTVALTYEFTENGIYQVCAKSVHCKEDIESCIDVTIYTDVIDCAAFGIKWNAVNENGSSAEFQITDNLDGRYVWKVNGEVAYEPENNDNGGAFFYEFPEAGAYTICANDVSVYCENAVEKCIEVNFEGGDDGVEAGFTIEVSNPEQKKSEEDCLNLVYDQMVSVNNSNVYILEATAFTDITNDYYGWSVNGELLATGRILEHEFKDVGMYTICVFIETPNCPMGVSFCKSFIVN